MRESHDPGQYEYHYNQEERLARQSAYFKKQDEKQGFFKRNRNLLIVFFDLLLLFIVFSIFFQFSDFGTPRIDGYRVRGRAFVFGESIHVTVIVSPRSNPVPDAAPLVLEVCSSDDTDNCTVFASAFLDGNSEEIFRTIQKVTDHDKGQELYLSVTIGANSRILKLALEKE